MQYALQRIPLIFHISCMRAGFTLGKGTAMWRAFLEQAAGAPSADLAAHIAKLSLGDGAAANGAAPAAQEGASQLQAAVQVRPCRRRLFHSSPSCSMMWHPSSTAMDQHNQDLLIAGHRGDMMSSDRQDAQVLTACLSWVSVNIKVQSLHTMQSPNQVG